MAHSLCIVVPCYNEEESLPPYCEAMEKIAAENDGASWNFVFVDDGSADGTLEFLQQLPERNPHYHYVSLSRNFGKEAAMLAGLEYALELGDDLFALMDVDLQDPPEVLAQMLQRMDASTCDVVAGYRATREGEPPIRSWFAHRFSRLMNKMSGLEVRDGARDFRVMRRYVVETIVAMPERTRFSKGIFSWVGFDTEWIGYENVEREHGETHWSFWQLTRYAIDGIVDFSSLPLEAISLAGLFVCFLALLFLIFIVVRALIFGDPVAGWPSLVCIITLLAGMQLFGMGVLGLYLSKVYTEVKARPNYIVKEKR